MKLIKIFPKLKIQFFPSNELYLKSLTAISFLVLISILIWIKGSSLSYEGFIPLNQPEKRLYVIVFLFLLWLLKLILVDLAAPTSLRFKDLQMQNKLQTVQKRFRGAIQFLKKTTISRHGKVMRLKQLPWYLFIGPAHAGKTTLLANSKVNFILQRQFQNQNIEHLEASENCDWWITRDASIIDVPGKYLNMQDLMKKGYAYPIFWRFFLRLIKKHRGKHALSGIIIALPFPELMREADSKNYQTLVTNLFRRLTELKKMFPATIPCHFLITKCDLLCGFTEFFCESGLDEIYQAWGVSLSKRKDGEKLANTFTERFDALIKKLNQQLIWRLHQERNSMARPYIKDFPLQIERIKQLTIDFIKKFSAAHLNLSLESVYLTSALQNHPEAESVVLEDTNKTNRTLQIFKEPIPSSRAYFIKQFFTHALATEKMDTPGFPFRKWKKRAAYTASISIIGAAALVLGRDFERGIEQTYSMQNYFSEYQYAIQRTQDLDEHLTQVTILLDALKESAKHAPYYKFNLDYILSFYSQKAQQKKVIVYQQALQEILVPELKLYLEDYLKNPVNKDSETIYAVLKAYVMLGETKYFQAGYITNLIKEILPKSMERDDAAHFIYHLSLALNSNNWNAISLNPTSIHQTRKFLTAMPSFQLGYLILKNLNNNNVLFTINLGKNPVFISKHSIYKLPNMFTAKFFSNVISQDVITAANEATVGNWILGDTFGMNKEPGFATALIEQLRVAYVNNYIDTWENFLSNIRLAKPKDLNQLDSMIVHLISNDSPLLQLLQIMHDNTYFEPIISSSLKLNNLGLLMEKNKQSEEKLYQIFSGLQSLHQYLRTIITADNRKKVAFTAVTQRMLNHSSPDAIMQLRLIANTSPEPIKTWLDKIANDAWHFLMDDAARYIDTSWQNKVVNFYQMDIANRYPFKTTTNEEVELKKFTEFFGNPGTLINFYTHYLQPFIDSSTAQWRWKIVDNLKLPFTDATARQIQYALQIHHAFFPNNDNKLFVQFALQPYKVDKRIKKIKLNINDKQIVDEKNAHSPHVVSWPNTLQLHKTSIQLTLLKGKTLNHDFSGDWGWFKLVNQSFESAITKKQILINLSLNQNPVKYLLFTESQFNPFLSNNLRRFELPSTLI